MEERVRQGEGEREGKEAEERLHAKFHLNVFTVSASGGQKPQFRAIFEIRGLPYRPLLRMRAKFGVLQQTKSLHLPAEFHQNVFTVSASGSQKPQFWANFDISGVPVLTTFYLLRLRLDWFILSPSGGKKLNFLPIFGLQHLVVSPIGSNLRKLNTGAQLQTFPYPTVSKSFLYSNAFMAK